MDVVGIGAATVDILARVAYFPTRREVQFAQEMSVQGGGPVATALVALQRLGASTALIDTQGDDWAGEFILKELQRECVDARGVQVIPGSTSAISSILVEAASGDRAITHFPASTPALELTDKHRKVIQSARILHLTGRHEQACIQAIEWARAAGVLISFDGGADRYRPALREIVPLTDICIVARDFAEKYTGESDIPSALAALAAEGPGIVGITEGIRGSWVHTQDTDIFHQPAYLFPQTIDTTGCGDSYHGAFLFGLLQGWDLTKTTRLASAAAGLVSQCLGGRQGLPSLREVEAFLALIDQ